MVKQNSETLGWEGGGRKKGDRREELCWRWLGIYLLYSLLIKPAPQQARGW